MHDPTHLAGDTRLVAETAQVPPAQTATTTLTPDHPPLHDPASRYMELGTWLDEWARPEPAVYPRYRRHKPPVLADVPTILSHLPERGKS